MADLERPQDAPTTGQFWDGEFIEEKKVFEGWRKDGSDIVERYRGDSATASKRPIFNLFWSNVETLKPTLLSRIPQPDVARRFSGDDPVYRTAAELLQKSLQAQNDMYNFGRELRRVRDDRLIVGRGVGRIVYEQVDTVPREGEQSQLVSQSVRFRHIYWEDFTHGPARCWEEVPWVRYRHWMNYNQVKERFGAEIAGKIAYHEPKGRPKTSIKQAEVFEVWAKSLYIEPKDENMEIGPDTGEIIWLSKFRGDDGRGTTGYKVLERGKPEVKFRGFFDCPEPIFATTTTDTMVPVPDEMVYKWLLDELDDVTERLHTLVGMAKVIFIGDGSLKELGDLVEANEGEIIATDEAQWVRDIGGLRNAIWEWPLEAIVNAIQALAVRQEQLIQMIYQVTGISDIIRGSTNPNETAAAQQLKSNFAQLRMGPRQMPMQEFVARVFEMQAEVIAEKFEDFILTEMTGEMTPASPEVQQAAQQLQQLSAALQQNPEAAQQMPPEMQSQLERLQRTVSDAQRNVQAMRMIENDPLRRFRLDVETDTLVAPDEAQAKQDAVEYLNAITPALSAAIQAPPDAKPLVFEILKGISRTFKLGRQVEEFMDEFAERAAEGQDETPSEAEIEAQAEREKAELQARVDMQEAQLASQTKLQEAQIKAQVDLQVAQIKAAMDRQIAVMEARMEARLEAMKVGAQERMAERQAANGTASNSE